jgi:hypothetical protein
MGLVDEPINSFIHFIAIKMNASYATHAETATSANTAKNANYSEQAGSAKTAVNSTYAQVSKEAERLHLGGTMIYIDPATHLIIFNVQGTDLSKSLMIDPVNRNILNVNLITDINGNQILPSQASGGLF